MTGKDTHANFLVESQDRVISFLADPATHDGSPIETNRTHASIIFLAGGRAYKLKLAVLYSFMDYSTLEKRRTACFDEVSLNRRTAPSLYLGVAPIIEVDGSLHIGDILEEPDQRDAIEWVVVMRRFHEESQFDRQLLAGTLDKGKLEETAKTIARFHNMAAQVEPFGGDSASEAQSAVLEGNLGWIRDNAGFDRQRVTTMLDKCRAMLSENAALLDRRWAEGWVRACHGDLHLRNICEVDGMPGLFDCIEFNPAFSRIDTLYDFSFLVMDLISQDALAEANILWRRYLEALPSALNGLAAMPLFLCMRAQIRAKVGAATAKLETDQVRAGKALLEAEHYFALGESFLAPAQPELIAIGGASGTGKSSLSAAIAPLSGRMPGAVVLRSDAIRKELFGLDQTERLPREAYEPAVSVAVYELMEKRARMVVEGGFVAILDATFTHPDSRNRVARLAKGLGVPFKPIWLEAPRDLLTTRILARQNDVSDATPAVLNDQLSSDWGNVGWPKIDASGRLEEMVDATMPMLRS